MVTAAGEKAKLLAVMVTVALAGGAVVVVATVVVGARVVVGTRVVVVVGTRVLVVVGDVVVVGWVVVVGARVVVVAGVLVVVDGASVVLGRTVVVVMESRTVTSVETWHPTNKALSVTSRLRRIPGHTQEAGRRFASSASQSWGREKAPRREPFRPN